MNTHGFDHNIDLHLSFIKITYLKLIIFEFLKSKLCKIMQDEEFLLDYEEEQAETKEHAKNDEISNGDGTKKIKVFKLESSKE